MTYGMYNPEAYEDVLRKFGVSRSSPIGVRSCGVAGFASSGRNPAPGTIELPTTSFSPDPHKTSAAVTSADYTSNAAVFIYSPVNPLSTPLPDESIGQPWAMGLIISQTAVMGISEPTTALGGHH